MFRVSAELTLSLTGCSNMESWSYLLHFTCMWESKSYTWPRQHIGAGPKGVNIQELTVPLINHEEVWVQG